MVRLSYSGLAFVMTVAIATMAPAGEEHELMVFRDKEINVVECMTVSEDGELVAAGQDSVVVWSAKTGKVTFRLRDHTRLVSSLAMSSDGKWLVSGSYDKSAIVWDMKTGENVRVMMGHKDAIQRVALGGHHLLTGTADDGAILWDIRTGKQLRRFSKPKVNYIYFDLSADAATFVTNAESPAGDMAAGELAIIWDVQTGDWRLTVAARISIGHVRLSPDGERLATGDHDGEVRLWEVKTGRQARVLNGHSDNITDIDFSGDGRYLVTSSWDGTAALWDVEKGKRLRKFVGHTRAVEYVRISKDGKRVFTGSRDGTVRMWDAEIK